MRHGRWGPWYSWLGLLSRPLCLSSISMPDEPDQPDPHGPLAVTQGSRWVPQWLTPERWRPGSNKYDRPAVDLLTPDKIKSWGDLGSWLYTRTNVTVRKVCFCFSCFVAKAALFVCKFSFVLFSFASGRSGNLVGEDVYLSADSHPSRSYLVTTG